MHHSDSLHGVYCSVDRVVILNNKQAKAVYSNIIPGGKSLFSLFLMSLFCSSLLSEPGSFYVAQVGLEFAISCLSLLSAAIINMHHNVWYFFFLNLRSACLGSFTYYLDCSGSGLIS